MVGMSRKEPAMSDSPTPTLAPDVPEMPQPHVEERPLSGAGGFGMLALVLVLVLGGIALLALIGVLGPVGAGLGGFLVLVGLVLAAGLTAVAPGEARVVQLFGRYLGTIRTSGFRWLNPFTQRRKISTRIRNHETEPAKVNDADGNPIEIAAVVVWQVRDTAKASFEVDDFEQFVGIQAETAVRHIANSYPYDAHLDGQTSLRDSADEI